MFSFAGKPFHVWKFAYWIVWVFSGNKAPVRWEIHHMDAWQVSNIQLMHIYSHNRWWTHASRVHGYQCTRPDGDLLKTRLSKARLIKGWCYGHDRRACILRTRPSCILHKSTIDTTVVYKTVVYVTDTTAARWRHTPTKLLPLTSPNPNTNPNPNPNRTLTLTLINPTKP